MASDTTGIPPLAGFTALQYLDFDNTAVASLAPLASTPNLGMLFMSSTQVTDLSPLRDLPLLKAVYVESQDRADALARTLGRDGIVRVR